MSNRVSFANLRNLGAIGLLAIALVGCSTTAPVQQSPSAAPLVSYDTSSTCSLQGMRTPKWAVDALPANADNVAFVKALIEELEQRKQYEQELLARINSCIRGN